ncbi:MAG: FtsX-like permease family protein [Roseiflexaceae bacterium]
MSIVWIKLLRDLWRFRGRTMMVVVSIATAVAAYGVVAITRDTLARDLDSQYRATNPASAVLLIAPALVDFTAELADAPELRAIEARHFATMKIRIGGGAWQDIDIHAADDLEQLRVSRPTIQPGALARPPQASIYLERSTLQLLPVRVGDQVEIQTAGGKVRTLTVAGLVNDMLPLPITLRQVVDGYMPLNTLRAIDEPQTYNRLYVVANAPATDRAAVEQAISEVIRRVEALGHPVLYAEILPPGRSPVADTMDTGLLVMGALVLLAPPLGVLLVFNLMSAVMAEQVRQVGILKTLGARTGQTFVMYLRMTLVFGLLAFVLAVPVGYIGADALVAEVARLLDVDVVSFHLPPRVLLVQALLAAGVPALGGLLPILQSVRLPIRATLDQLLASGPGRGLLPRLANAEWSSQIRALGLRNVFRRRLRVGLTVGALGLSGALFVSMLNLRATMQAQKERILGERAFGVEVQLAQRYPAALLQREALAVPGVAAAELWWTGTAQRVYDNGHLGGSLTIYGVPPGSQMINAPVTSGRWPDFATEHALFINIDGSVMTGQPAVGQQVTLRVEGRDRSWPLAGVSSRNWRAYAYVPAADLERLIGAPGYANRLVVRTTPDDAPTQQRVRQALLDRFSALRIDVSTSSTVANWAESIGAQIDIVVVVLLVVALLVAAVGCMGLASTMNLNVLERTREIGVLRALGAGRGVIYRLVVVESLVIGAMGGALGLLLSAPLTIGLSRLIGMQLVYTPLPAVFTWPPVAIWLAGVLVLCAIASIIPARRAAGLTVREAVAFER